MLAPDTAADESGRPGRGSSPADGPHGSPQVASPGDRVDPEPVERSTPCRSAAAARLRAVHRPRRAGRGRRSRRQPAWRRPGRHHVHRHLGCPGRDHRRPHLPRDHRLQAVRPRRSPAQCLHHLARWSRHLGRGPRRRGRRGLGGPPSRGATCGLADCVAPAIPLAQAIGRWGNCFNQELYGKPTTLPVGPQIDCPPARRPVPRPHLPPGLSVRVALGPVRRRGRAVRRAPLPAPHGLLFAVYVAAYTFGRFFTEYERIDIAHKIGPLRLNDWTSVIVFAGTLCTLIVANHREPSTGLPRSSRPAPNGRIKLPSASVAP